LFLDAFKRKQRPLLSKIKRMLKVKLDFDFLRAAVSACVKGEEEEEEEEGAELKHKS
jgi:hypothetical protein